MKALVLLLLLLLTGTIFYSYSEGWNALDALYFSVTTLATVSYGDFHPTNSASKIFTILYIFCGVGLGIFALTKIKRLQS